MPKESEVLNIPGTGDYATYELVKADTPEISPMNRTATFTFTVNRDEPYQEDNKVWMNWGVFDSPSEFNADKVYGSREAKTYDIYLTYSDYFDRVFINSIYLLVGLSGMFTFWLAAPVQMVPMAVLALYVMFQPIWIWFTAPVSQKLSFD